LNPASDAVYVGPSRERTANGRRSSAGQHRVHSCDRRKAWAGPRRLGPGVQGSPQREPALPTETAREQSTRGARSSHPFGAGVDRSPVAARGQAVVRRTYPEELRRLSSCVLSIAYRSGSTMIYRNVAKISGVLTHRTYTNILGASRQWSSNFRRIVPESAKRHPQFVR